LFFVAVHDVELVKEAELEPSENLVVKHFSKEELIDELHSQKDNCGVDGSLTTAWLYYSMFEQK
jgi:hypothetical protein